MGNFFVKSFAELYEAVGMIRSDFGNPPDLWFRGQGSSKFQLIPYLLRKPQGITRELEMFRTFKRLAPTTGINCDDDWETLINMQHYGIPTRLLDWTTNFGVALYFACKSHVLGDDMRIFVLDPHRLNRKSSRSDIPMIGGDKCELEYVKNFIENKPFPARYPIAVKSNYVNRRVLAQSGTFTINGNSSIDPLQSDIGDSFAIIDFSDAALQSISDFFSVVNIDDFSVFPDIQGIARYISGMV